MRDERLQIERTITDEQLRERAEGLLLDDRQKSAGSVNVHLARDIARASLRLLVERDNTYESLRSETTRSEMLADFLSSCRSALTQHEQTMGEVRDVIEGWTDPVIPSYEERCDTIRAILAALEVPA